MFSTIANALTPGLARSRDASTGPTIASVLPAPVANMLNSPPSPPKSASLPLTNPVLEVTDSDTPTMAKTESNVPSSGLVKPKVVPKSKQPKPNTKVAVSKVVKSPAKPKAKPAKVVTAASTRGSREKRTRAPPDRFAPEEFKAPVSKAKKGYWGIKGIEDENEDDYLVQWTGTDPKTKKPYKPEWVDKSVVTAGAVRDWKAKNMKKVVQKARKQKRTVLKAKKEAKRGPGRPRKTAK